MAKIDCNEPNIQTFHLGYRFYRLSDIFSQPTIINFATTAFLSGGCLLFSIQFVSDSYYSKYYVPYNNSRQAFFDISS